MQVKKNIVISIVVIVVLGGYLLLNKFSSRELLQLPEVSCAISQIVIAKDGNSITIIKDGDSWKVNGFEADKNVIANIENKLKDIEVVDFVSEKPLYERFELDPEHAIHVVAKCGDTVVRDFYVGKKGSTYRHTYVRFEGNKAVYLAADTLDTYFNKTVDDLRNKDIVQLDIARVNTIQLWYKNSSITLQKKIVEKKNEKHDSDEKDKPLKEKQKDAKSVETEKEEQWVCKENPTLQLDTNKVKEILYTFDPLKAYSFPQVDTAMLKGKIASLTVAVQNENNEKAAEEISLTVHKEYENNRYICTCSKTPYVFTIDEWRAKRIFKTLQDLKK
ncbi:MAG TPA: DUF4340 domain-containing protein [Spirochaetota bacterium]|nr:DUF4340 domain-containing protein [Spirochaetota bacterium]HQK06174.1 DUF4340 domain-containing protein [Spirochaetota bacterium]